MSLLALVLARVLAIVPAPAGPDSHCLQTDSQPFGSKLSRLAKPLPFRYLLRMATYTQALRNLTGALLNPEEMSTLEALLSPLPMDFIAFVKYDDLIGWASITRIESESYHVDDREVFRPLQYCGTYLSKMAEQQGEWLTRETVHMAGVHLETLVGRISLVHKIPLGQAIMKKLFKESVTPETWDHLDQFRIIFNAAKHDMTHTKDTHLFSYEDAVLAYVVCRKLGIALKPYCSFKTEWCL